MKLTGDKYALTTFANGVPLICPVKKYTRRSQSSVASTSGGSVILILGHGGGFSKEHWEPFLEDLFDIDDGKAREIVVREAWAVDAPNHGQGAILNEDILARNPSLADIWDYADAVVQLTKSGLLGALNPDIDRVVLCGHSAGAVAGVLSTCYFNPPSRIPFSEIILVDPAIWSRSIGDKAFTSDMYKAVKKTTPVRRDIWDSKGAVAAWMKQRLPFSRWDNRVLDRYVEYGLRPLPTAHYPDKTTGVTLTTHRLEENMSFTGYMFSLHAADRLSQISTYRPVHLIYGGLSDMFHRDVQDSLFNDQERRVFASVSRLSPKVGHLVVQEAPYELAQSVFLILCKRHITPSVAVSKL